MSMNKKIQEIILYNTTGMPHLKEGGAVVVTCSGGSWCGRFEVAA